ncbi:hypothetical protein BCU43_022505 [Vibrio lentus]|nr:hypothetical protein [Vibrio lentus]PMI58338.1 hypothetical protein BCU43_13150 [Vibrio lentus]
MSKRKITLIALEAALKRITLGKPQRIPATRKLSIRAVEEEANLGNGSGYYYPDFVQKVKEEKANIAQNSSRVVQPEIQVARSKLNNEKRIKENYREKYEVLKADLAQFAAAQHHLSDKLVQALSDKEELEFENANLRTELAELKRSRVVPIK